MHSANRAKMRLRSALEVAEKSSGTITQPRRSRDTTVFAFGSSISAAKAVAISEKPRTKSLDRKSTLKKVQHCRDFSPSSSSRATPRGSSVVKGKSDHFVPRLSSDDRPLAAYLLVFMAAICTFLPQNNCGFWRKWGARCADLLAQSENWHTNGILRILFNSPRNSDIRQIWNCSKFAEKISQLMNWLLARAIRVDTWRFRGISKIVNKQNQNNNNSAPPRALTTSN